MYENNYTDQPFIVRLKKNKPISVLIALPMESHCICLPAFQLSSPLLSPSLQQRPDAHGMYSSILFVVFEAGQKVFPKPTDQSAKDVGSVFAELIPFPPRWWSEPSVLLQGLQQGGGVRPVTCPMV